MNTPIPSLRTLCVALLTVSSALAAEDAPKPATIDEYRSDPQRAAATVAEYKGNTYGFVITNKGAIRAIHDASGKIIFDGIGEWVLQRNGTEHAGWINDTTSEAIVSESNEGANKVFNVEILHPRLIQKMKIVCREIGPDITANFEIVDFSSGEGLNFPVNLNATNVESLQPNPTENPVPYSTKDGGTLAIGYSSENFSPYGNKGNGTYMPGPLGFTLYPKFDGSKEAGAKDTISLDIQVP